MAITMQSILLMSCDVDRVFSSSKLSISDHHNHLGDAVTYAVECVMFWDRAGLIEMKDIPHMKDLRIALECWHEQV